MTRIIASSFFDDDDMAEKDGSDINDASAGSDHQYDLYQFEVRLFCSAPYLKIFFACNEVKNQ